MGRCPLREGAAERDQEPLLPPSTMGRLSAIAWFAGTNCRDALSRGWSRADATR